LAGATAVALAAALVAGCAVVERGATAGAAHSRPDDARERQVLATLQPGNERIWSHVAEELRILHGVSLRASWFLRSLGEQCLVLEVPAGRAAAEVAVRLATHPRVATASPTRRFRLLAGEDDPYAPLQSAEAPLRLAEAHRLATGRGVSVAVVDTGLELTHPDLVGRVRRAHDFAGRERGQFTSELHGTAVAGVIAARAGNGIGGLGVAPQADLWALRACWQEPAGARGAVCDSYTLAQALDLAVVEGARVVNLSLAGEPDALLERLVRTAIAKGAVVVTAAEGDPPDFPASVAGVVAVHAWPGERPRPPGAPPIPDGALVAPGVDILTTVPPGGFDFVSGSSFSAAQVSGVVALLLERAPGLAPAEVARLLAESATPASTAPAAPRLVDACAALARALGRDTC
jgi:subtilisin family serine protease